MNDLALVGLVGEERQSLLDGVLFPYERLVGLHDLAHAFLDASQVVFGEVRAAGQVEVVIEAVVDGRADRELGARPQLGDRLRQHVRGRVPQHVAAFVGVGGDDRYRRAVVQRNVEVDLFTVDHRGQRRLGQTRTDRRGQIRRRRVLLQRLR